MNLLTLSRIRSVVTRLFSLDALCIICGVLAIFWVCTFKIMDRDFWWHITAGKMLLSSGWITLDPFAYTRDGLPYLATHEWLAQIILSVIYQTFGSTGIILFRGVIASLSVWLLLLLAPRRLFPNVLLAVWAVVIAKGSFLERPQLFTFVIFCAFLLLAFRWLDADTAKRRRWICVAFIFSELLWVNVHGGAALVGCAIVMFLLLRTVFFWWKGVHREDRQDVFLLFGTLIVMTAVIVSPPNGFGTFEYVWNLLNDQTIVYIAEWKPRDWSLYVIELWPFWIAGLGSLILGRRHWIFNALLLMMTAYLSRQAFRHEILFIFASLATCFYQLQHSATAEEFFTRMEKRRVATTVFMIVLLLVLGRSAYRRSLNFEQQDNLFGFGQFDLARGAYDFLERLEMQGKMFNTYGIGGYLIHRGYPDRKVFIDGRNVDYGMDFMTHTYAAGVNEQHWKSLTEQYDVTYAVVDYDAIREKDRLPYSSHLDVNPDWPLVYLDDWVAVYAKKIPENQTIIDRFQYKILTATDLQFRSDFAHIPMSARYDLVRELERVREDNPEGVKATLALGSLALGENLFDDATSLAKEAMRVRPFAPEPYALLGAVDVSRQRWKEASQSYDMLLQLAGDHYPDLNYDYIADVFVKAERPWKAWFVRPWSHAPMIVPSSMSGAVSSEPVRALPNPSLDAQDFNDQGVAYAENMEWTEAEHSFRTAIMLSPSFAEAWNNLCALLVSQKHFDDAIDACKRAIDVAPDLADAHFNLALAYYHKGSLDDAKREALEAKNLGRVEESNTLLQLVGKKERL